MVSTGTVRSTASPWLADAGLPALSLTEALTVYWLAVRLLRSAVGKLTLQLPSAWTEPL
ncbi:hypothetical protein OkiPb00183_08000 [Escherichia coli]